MSNPLTNEILDQVNQVILGKEDVVKKVLLAILGQGHVLLEDVPGVGKTTMANAFSRVLGMSTNRVQFTSDTLPSDIVGFSVYDKQTGGLKYQPGAVMTNLLLADEINRTSSKTQSALLEAMEERQVTVDGESRPLPKPFVVLATQNPVGSAGTQMLPSSQLDRFMLKLSMGYPDLKSQMLLMKERHHENPLDRCKAVVTCEQLTALSKEAMDTYVADCIYEYIAQIAEATRHNDEILLGLSPRGTLAVCRAAKANAYLSGKDFVSTEDVLTILPDVVCHRLVLSAKARLHEKTPGMLLTEILSGIPKPDVREFKI